jgi:hypothetical protein
MKTNQLDNIKKSLRDQKIHRRKAGSFFQPQPYRFLTVLKKLFKA